MDFNGFMRSLQNYFWLIVDFSGFTKNSHINVDFAISAIWIILDYTGFIKFNKMLCM